MNLHFLIDFYFVITNILSWENDYLTLLRFILFFFNLFLWIFLTFQLCPDCLDVRLLDPDQVEFQRPDALRQPRHVLTDWVNPLGQLSGDQIVTCKLDKYLIDKLSTIYKSDKFYRTWTEINSAPEAKATSEFASNSFLTKWNRIARSETFLFRLRIWNEILVCKGSSINDVIHNRLWAVRKLSLFS